MVGPALRHGTALALRGRGLGAVWVADGLLAACVGGIRGAALGVWGSYTSQTKRLKEKLVELEAAFAALSREAAQAS